MLFIEIDGTLFNAANITRISPPQHSSGVITHRDPETELITTFEITPAEYLAFKRDLDNHAALISIKKLAGVERLVAFRHPTKTSPASK